MSTRTDTSSDVVVAGSFEGDLRRYLRGLGGLLVFLFVWWVGAMTTQPSYLVPGPLDSARAFIDLFATSTAIVVPVSGSRLVLPTGFAHLAQTLFHYVPGLLLGASCGISLGLAMGWNGALDDWLRPLVRVLRPIPPLAWIGRSTRISGRNQSSNAPFHPISNPSPIPQLAPRRRPGT
jgi:NitT/TauT family transport system permease protein